MKNKLYIILVSVLILFCVCSTAKADIAVGFSPVSQQVPLGSPFPVDLTIAGLGNGTAPSLGTYDIDIYYNPNILTLTNVAYGTSLDVLGFGSIQMTTPGTGTVNLFELSLDATSDLNALQPPAFTIAELTFTGISNGTSLLTININALGDADANALAAVVSSGSASVVPLPSALLLFAPGLLTLNAIRRKLKR